MLGCPNADVKQVKQSGRTYYSARAHRRPSSRRLNRPWKPPPPWQQARESHDRAESNPATAARATLNAPL